MMLNEDSAQEDLMRNILNRCPDMITIEVGGLLRQIQSLMIEGVIGYALSYTKLK